MISINNLSVEFSAKALFDNINYVINPRDRIALVGKNGAGKSTLMKLLLRLYDPTHGCITYDKIPLPAYPLKKLRQKCSAVFQNYELIAATL